MFFDLHTDILYNVVKNRLNGKKNIIKDFHVPQLIKGNISGGIWTYYTDVDNPLCDFEVALDFILQELEDASDVINIVKSKNDFINNKINVILGFESLKPIKDINHLQKMHAYGFRHAMLTWNEQNHFATGINSNTEQGLTKEGIEVINFMNKNNMIVDVSHANYKTSIDIINLVNKPLIASHSNIFNLCNNLRNLKDDQIKKIATLNGTIGITAVRNFIKPNTAVVSDMVDHIEYLKINKMLDNISIGFDFMDYLTEEFNDSNLVDLNSAIETQNLIKELEKREFSQSQIAKITHLNALRVVKSILN